ncbi:MAG: thiamine pyrophosphate-dependent enzyme [Myxococcaceae bacterium]|nr:thiamine pyrophosphate-dependent enzyme [Myxococcaceae bacterium]MCI0669912.1 thiamine pyrophosphate-dependent enzyme [Myxococcaceae bacterium]
MTLFCGSGCKGAHAEVLAVAAALQAPVGHTFRGKEWMEHDNPYDVGMTGLLGLRAAYQAMHACDVLLLLGTDFPYDAFMPVQPHIAQVDIRPEVLGRRSRLDLGLCGDVRETLRALLPRLELREDRTHLERALDTLAHERRSLDAHVRDVSSHRPLHPEFVAATLDAVAAEDAVFTVDTGMCNVWAARYIRGTGHRRIIGSFNHSSMANALPQAIGAQLLHPDRQVISMSGDGGFAMLLGDFLTLAQYELPVKAVVFDNGALGMVKLEMQASGYPDWQTDLVNPDFAKLAEAVGVMGVRVESPGDVRWASVDNLPIYTVRNKTTGDVITTTDPGKANRTGKWADMNRFKVPSLRGLTARAPYFHNGVAKDLHDVVKFYEESLGFDFTDEEEEDLVHFMNAL